MRIWIILSAIVLLLFCVPGLALTLATPDLTYILIYLVLIALAVHGLYYCKIAKTEPVAGYKHLAVNQLVLGLVCAALLARLSWMLSDPVLWEQGYQQTIELMQRLMGTQVSQQQIQQAWHEVVDPLKHKMIQLPLWVALLTVISQGFFAWLLYRRARPATPIEAEKG